MCGIWNNGAPVVVAGTAPDEQGFWLCRVCNKLQPDTLSKGCDFCGAPVAKMRFRRDATMTSAQVIEWARARGLVV